MEEKYTIGNTITSRFDYENKKLLITTELEGLIGKRVQEEIDFKDECVRKALIALGWTPPPNNMKKEK